MKYLKRGVPIAPPGIRMQLTLWYTGVSAVLLLLFVVAVYSSLQSSLSTSLDTALQMRSQQIAEGITKQNGQLVVENIVHELPELNATAALIDSFDSDSSDVSADNPNQTQGVSYQSSTFIRIFDASGKVVYSTTAFATLKPPSVSVTDPLHSQPWRGTLIGTDGQEIRLYSTMLLDRTQLFGVVQVGQSLSDLKNRLQDITLALALSTPIVLLFSAALCYWLAGRAFRPIHLLAYTAREIEATDLHRRVSVPRAHDEVRELATIFNQMIERLEFSFAQQHRFVADASHELRTPVAVIRSITDVALSLPSEPEEYVKVLQDVNAEAERLGQLISSLLTLARADESQVHFDADEVRLDLLTADVVESMEPLAAERQLALCTGPLQEVTVTGDAARLIQVIMSLVDNAITYTNPGGRITLSLRSQQEWACLSVNDTGIGISPKDKEHIFERFYRADPARSRAAGGSGLGLAIVDWIIRAHHGTIAVESLPGKGSTFTVRLPLA